MKRRRIHPNSLILISNLSDITMNTSIIFREDQNPIFRAKIPLDFFGFPFRSAIEFADADNLSFTFSTFFRSAPSFNLSYRPNHSFNPLSLAVKAGIGLFGSPIDSPMTFTAEFDLPANQPPRFFLHFSPRLGDFTLRRSLQSHIEDVNSPYRNSISRLDAALSKGKSVDGGDSSREADGDLGLGNAVLSAQRIDCSQVLNRFRIDDAISSVEINARSTVKVKDWAAVKFRWSMRFPAIMKKEDFTAKIPFSKMPYLALGKIKIERAAANDGEQESNATTEAGEFSALKKQLDDLWTEIRWLKRNIEPLRSETGEQKAAPATPPVESWKKGGA